MTVCSRPAFVSGRASGSLFLLVCFIAAGGVSGTETQRWVSDTASDLLQGHGSGVAVTDDGRLVRAVVWSEAVSLSEPVVMAGAITGDGELIVGTGFPARLYRINRNEATLLTDLPGEQVTSLLAMPSGELLVATLSPGLLLRWRGGEAEEVGRLGEGGIWDLAQFDGAVVAAAGPPASLYRLAEQGLERWSELPDAHARCLEPSGDSLLVGTSGKGLILRLWRSGQITLVADSPFTEISDMTLAPDGSLWAVALVGEPPQKPEPQPGQGQPTATTDTSALSLDLPKVNGTTASSEVLRLTPEGALLKVHRFTKQVASSLAWDDGGVLVGTGFEGEVWRFVTSGGARLATVDAVQVVAIVGGGSVLLTQGPGSVLRRSGVDGGPATYRSAAKELERPVRFGEFRVEPPHEQVRIRFRSGVSGAPDELWLPWSDWQTGGTGTVPLAPARSLQWEIELPVSLHPPEGVERVEVAYREVNLAPRLEEVEVGEPGAVYLDGPPPAGPVIEAEHPDFSGIFTAADEPSGAPNKPKQGKKYWRVGYRTVSWKAVDDNQDPLLFTLKLERRDGFQLPVRERLETTQLALDTTAVPDATYRLLIEATDEPRNPADPLQATASSQWFVVDNTPPTLAVERRGARWQVVARDAISPLVRVEWSRDGERWLALAPDDGVLDGREESLGFPVASGRHLVVVRAYDEQHNRAVVGVVEE